MILKGIIDNDRYRIERIERHKKEMLRVPKYIIVHSKVSNKVLTKVSNNSHKRQVQGY